jgi:hypothetical protein
MNGKLFIFGTVLFWLTPFFFCGWKGGVEGFSQSGELSTYRRRPVHQTNGQVVGSSYRSRRFQGIDSNWTNGQSFQWALSAIIHDMIVF